MMLIICIELYLNYKSIWKVSIRTAGIEIGKVFGCYTRGLPCHQQTRATLTSHSKWNEVTESYANSVLHFQTAVLSPHQISPVSFSVRLCARLPVDHRSSVKPGYMKSLRMPRRAHLIPSVSFHSVWTAQSFLFEPVSASLCQSG